MSADPVPLDPLTLPANLPDQIVEAIGDSVIAQVRQRSRSIVAYELHSKSGWPLRLLKVSAANDPFSAVAELDRLDWLERRLPSPKVLASAPIPDGGHALVFALPPGTPATAAEHHVDPVRTVDLVAQALRFVHEIPVDNCPFSSRVELRLRSIRRRARAGYYDPAHFSEPYRRYSVERLLEILADDPPPEDELVFTHGLFDPDSVLLDQQGVVGILDFDRAGTADRYVDLSRAALAIAEKFTPELIPRFFQSYGIPRPDPRKLDYYQLLAEFG
jgi:aminoglycoside 3'-phosphotransferase-2